MVNIDLLKHNAITLAEDFPGIKDWNEANRVALEVVIPRLSLIHIPLPGGGLIYPFLSETDYDPRPWARIFATAAVAYNKGHFILISDTPIQTAEIYPDFICRGCGNLSSDNRFGLGYRCNGKHRWITLGAKLNG